MSDVELSLLGSCGSAPSVASSRMYSASAVLAASRNGDPPMKFNPKRLPAVSSSRAR